MASKESSTNGGWRTVFIVILVSLTAVYSNYAEFRKELWQALVSSTASRDPSIEAKNGTRITASNNSFPITGNRNESHGRIHHQNSTTSTIKIDSEAVKTNVPAMEPEEKLNSMNSSTIADKSSDEDSDEDTDEDEDGDGNSSSEEAEDGLLSHVWHMPPHLSSEGQNPKVGSSTELNETSIELFENAAKYGLTPSEGCSNRTNETQAWCGKQGCWRTFPINSTQLESSTTCKTFWFAGFSLSTESECKAGGYGGYRNDYAVALQSALYNAKDTLQPVLLVGKYTMEDVPMPAVVEWAAAQGAIIITVDELSFQDLMTKKLNKNQNTNHMGPFLRIDIPFIVQQHKLMDLPGICDRYVLYTDSDVAFVNKITQYDLDKLKKQIDPSTDAYTLYGHQEKSSGHPKNSGVMLFDIYRFQEAWPSFLQFGYEKGPFLSFDQGWINDYFGSTPERLLNRTLLENEWNWKSYWRLAPNEWHQVKIIHFHGPKIGKSLESMAHCDMSDWVFDNYGKTYAGLVKNGICCDQGMTAKFMLDLYYELSPPRSIKC